MMKLSSRAWRASVAAAILAPAMLVGCGFKDDLLEPQQPGIISPDVIASAGATGAQALYVGALGAFKDWTGGGGNTNSQNLWMYSDLMTDVWKVSDTFEQRINMDRRVVQDNDAEVSGRYSTATQSRGFYRDAMAPLREFRPTEPEKEGEMYFLLGYTEMNMSEVFCNGIPFSETVAGQVIYAEPVTNQEGFAMAITHFDSAIALASGTGALAVKVRTAAQIAKARTLVNMGQFAAAAAVVTGINTNYQYTLTYSQPTQDNTIWTTNFSSAGTARYVVGDSVAMVNGVETRIRNAIPFASANDPRIPVTGAWNNASSTGFDGSTPYVRQRIWDERDDPIVVASGIDARLIEAEAALNANDIPGMMTILNGIRTTSRTLGEHVVPAMAALATPATQAAATDLLFREKAFWQFARGTRLGDLRRLMRQYSRAEDAVFPEGGFHKTPFEFGNDVNLPITDNERSNPLFTGCIDRNP
jgi:hypothetical protein